MSKIGFDNDKYIKLQSQKIRDRIDKFGGKLYMEFGGKLFDDYHAARVLPGIKLFKGFISAVCRKRKNPFRVVSPIPPTTEWSSPP